MIKIAHRGNTNGINLDKENHPDYIDDAINNGFDSEIDIWLQGRRLYLGHDEPKYAIDKDWLFLRSEKLWCHAKNIDALNWLLRWDRINCFWHQEDNYTITSKKFIWTTNYFLSDKLIFVSPNLKINESKNNYNCVGICSDYFS
tara:strand:+ start:3148 stop:3579 length:432 start_codon:yes stop_codon:yes gene_type:complete